MLPLMPASRSSFNVKFHQRIMTTYKLNENANGVSWSWEERGGGKERGAPRLGSKGLVLLCTSAPVSAGLMTIFILGKIRRRGALPDGRF